MKILTKIAIAIPLIAIALVLQANGTSTTQGDSAFKTGVSGCTNSAILACGGDCTNKLQFTGISCTNSAILACGGGCTNKMQFTGINCTNSAILACGGGCTNKLQFTSIGCTNSALFAAAGCTNSLTVAYRLL